jgi:hypothetical protein
MTETIHAGTMFIADGTHMPQSLVAGTERYAAGWSSITKSTSDQAPPVRSNTLSTVQTWENEGGSRAESKSLA